MPREFPHADEHAEIYRRLAELETEVAVLQSQMDTFVEAMKAISGLPTQVVQYNGDVKRYCERVEGLSDDIKYLRKKIKDREDERKQERIDASHERKADRRWLVGTLLASTGLLISGIVAAHGAGLL